MIISKIRNKINSGVRFTKRNIIRLVSKDPKRKFYFGKYYIKREIKKDRILIDTQKLSDNITVLFIKALYSRTNVNNNEIYLVVEHAEIAKVRQQLSENNLHVNLVDRNSYKYLEILSSAGYLLSTHALPPYFVKKDGQTYLHIWNSNEKENISELSQYIFDNIGKLQHSILQSSYLCFCCDENRQTVIDILCLMSLYTGKIVSTSEKISECIDKILDCLLENNTEKFITDDFSGNKTSIKRLIIPHKIKQSEDLKTLAEYVQNDDIVQFTANQLNRSMRTILREEYQSEFDYIIVTTDFPRSYKEEIKMKLGNQSVIDKVETRNKLRKYGCLQFMENEVRDIRVLQTGCSISNAEINALEAEYEIVDNSYLKIELQDLQRYEVKQLLLANKKNVITCMREVTEEERTDGKIKIDFSLWKDALGSKGSYQILADVWDKQEKRRILSCFSNHEITKNKKEKNEKFYNHASYLEPVFLEKNAYLCYQNGKERLTVVVCAPGRVLHQQMQAKLLRMKSGKSTIKIYCRLKKLEGMVIKDVVLRYRSVMSYDIPVNYTVKEKKDYYFITADIDFSKINLRELYWDFYILVEKYGKLQEIFVKFPNQYWKCKFYITNKDYKAGEGHVIFPYYTVINCLAFLYRASSPYDVYSTKLKDMVACVIYIFAKPFLKRKHIWLVFEKFCTMAQDNGYYFFKYCMENLTEEEKKNIYYVIDKNAPDYDKVKKYGRHVIPFMSLKHCIYILGASIYVGSDAMSHLYAWRSKTSLIRSKMINRPIFFLQHGVTALKDVSKIFGVNGSSSMTYFATTSKFEQEIVVNQLQYKKENAPITGFTRWDVLEDTSKKEDKLILMMPTWRSWLEEVTDDDFQKSDYYLNYSHILQDDKLLKILEKYDVRMIFYIHPKFASFQKNFTGVGDRIILVPFGAEPLNELIKKCHMLITDYSSVCWDVYYQKKPVVFYQFDYDKYNIAHGSFINLETELFGRRATDEKTLLKHVEECIASGFKMLEEDEKKHSYYFEYIDNKNSQRTYEYLKNRGY